MKTFMSICVLLTIMSLGHGHRICTTDSDCTTLGSDLVCMKSACNWGVCGCTRGYAARFSGSSKGYQCVKLKKIGESCSTDDSKGVCGAANSNCKDGECTCHYLERWGGKECATSKYYYPTETCNDGASCYGPSSCKKKLEWNGAYRGTPVAGLPNSPFDDVPNVCACPTGYRTAIQFVPNDDNVGSFLGSKVPTCKEIAVGDQCYVNQDCGRIKMANGLGAWTSTDGAECVNNVCKCKDVGHRPDITGLYCANALSYGDKCMYSNTAVNSSVGVCDGSLGLRCGDPCDLEKLLEDGDFTCICDPSYKDNGGSCAKRTVGSQCYGDLNCKAIGDTAVCVDNYCAESGASSTGINILFTLSVMLITCLSIF